MSHLSIDTGRPQPYIVFTEAMKGELTMANETVTFSDQEQQQVEAIVIDKDGDEALRYLGELIHKFKLREGHACGPKTAETPPGHG
jgi:hypothetical protein